jgi:hypothetical protein
VATTANGLITRKRKKEGYLECPIFASAKRGTGFIDASAMILSMNRVIFSAVSLSFPSGA